MAQGFSIDLSGKTALVTGGVRGIGLACSRYLAQAGANVVMGYHRNADAAQQATADLQAYGVKAVAVGGDLSQEADAAALFDAVEAMGGRLDVAVVNAGIWRGAAIDQMTFAQWSETMKANLDSAFQVCSRAARVMKRQGQGKLILIGSTAGQRGEAGYSHYAASKGAITALTRSLGAELGPFNINVNCVAPGWVLTDMTRDVFADKTRAETIAAQIPLRRIAEPEDIAGPVLFLASELSRHLQGSVLSVNGGSVMA